MLWGKSCDYMELPKTERKENASSDKMYLWQARLTSSTTHVFTHKFVANKGRTKNCVLFIGCSNFHFFTVLQTCLKLKTS